MGEAVFAERGGDAAREEAPVDAGREAGVPGGRAEALGGDEEVAEAAGAGEVGGDAGVVVDGGGVAADVGEQREDLAIGGRSGCSGLRAADVGEDGDDLGLGAGVGIGIGGRNGGCGLQAGAAAARRGWRLRGGGHGHPHGDW